jgi:hypothetical protein
MSVRLKSKSMPPQRSIVRLYATCERRWRCVNVWSNKRNSESNVRSRKDEEPLFWNRSK